jgi:hypothetical protein
LTEVRVKVLEPTPLAVLEDKVTFVAVMVKDGDGVAANSGMLESVTVTTARTPRTARKRTLCMADTFPRAACTLPVALDEV